MIKLCAMNWSTKNKGNSQELTLKVPSYICLHKTWDKAMNGKRGLPMFVIHLICSLSRAKHQHPIPAEDREGGLVLHSPAALFRLQLAEQSIEASSTWPQHLTSEVHPVKKVPFVICYCIIAFSIYQKTPGFIIIR